MAELSWQPLVARLAAWEAAENPAALESTAALRQFLEELTLETIDIQHPDALLQQLESWSARSSASVGLHDVVAALLTGLRTDIHHRYLDAPPPKRRKVDDASPAMFAVPVANTATPRPLDDALLCRVGREEVELDERQVLGCGAYASVCLGRFRGAHVAVKRFRQSVPTEAFEREVRIASRLRHPNIVMYMGFHRLELERWILLEWAELGSLFNLLHSSDAVDLSRSRRVRLTWAQKLAMARDVASAMVFLHMSRYRHCDLNSKNLLVTRDLRVKVADMGLSHEIVEGEGSQLPDRRVGTLRWMSPEMLSKDCQSMEKSDVYSFGVVMLELATERIPYPDKLDDDVRRLILKQVPPSAGINASHWRECPPFRDLMQACLQHNPSARPDFQTILATLNELLSQVADAQ